MSQVGYYKKYLDQVDTCLSVNNNPELAQKIVDELVEILVKYKAVNYTTYHFEYFYDSFFNNLEELTKNGDLNGLKDASKDFFEDYIHIDLKKISEKLDLLLSIYNNTEEEELKEKIKILYNEIVDEVYFSYSDIENYYKRAVNLIKEHNYSPSTQKTIVVENKGKSCVVILIFFPFFLISYFIKLILN